jgi:leucyl aminopeptidase
MQINIRIAEKLERTVSYVILAGDDKPLATSLLTIQEKHHVAEVRKLDPDRNFIVLPRIGATVVVILMKKDALRTDQLESCRRSGSKLSDLLADQKRESVTLVTTMAPFEMLVALAEGLLLASYRFLKYFSDSNRTKKAHPLCHVALMHRKPDYIMVQRLKTMVYYTCMARDLVNEPATGFDAQGLAQHIATRANELGVKTEIFNKRKIEALKMGGLLAVNRGSVDPPAFTVLDYSPTNAINDRPVILVGKGLIFDTGGMNLKPGNFMDGMKSDMAGAATMASALLAAAELQLPLRIVALLPSTDNRVNGNAMVPGDVITMHDGTTVEVNNTDAEGRLILADALSYARRYDPMLVLDAATLTGAAARAIGPWGIVAMHQKADRWMTMLKSAGEECYERIAEFPMWKEYEEQLKSDIADLSNIGGANAGAITAGKFLAHFTDYPFIHLDIAGTALFEKREHYQPKGGTGSGVRLILSLFDQIITSNQKKS